ncbi:ABC transporter ATP-binding protein [Lyngbya confervoides]|uniref:ABC transporter ATP-binding protein n=1 Tax=Lyngbya confervoides BDU141951 TaxID=1574623 RepID=A0ABD4SZW4_9CYAN|nr:ABC transporter ATP-binding protein [Lyngbya confervoides]MCM1981824.1 ABC transporter ATP-binding protein [Lyngbya confervoides BDU141951]
MLKPLQRFFLVQPRSQTSGNISAPPDKAAAAICVQGLGKVFNSKKEAFPALSDINFSVPQGQLQMLVGPSGAGKTTLLLIIAGLLSPSSGQVWLMGSNLYTLSRLEREQFRLRNLGIMFQEANLMNALTVAENLAVALALKGIHGPANQDQVKDLLQKVGLTDWGNYLPHKLSGGQQQRAALARAVAGQPKILIADEPTGALDSVNGMKIMALIEELIQSVGCSVLMSTHDPRIVSYADRLIHIEDGCIKGGIDQEVKKGGIHSLDPPQQDPQSS